MTAAKPIITLTTDFGCADGTVGAMIGVIKSICPEAEVVNVASDVPAHDIPRGAWALYQAAPFFPAHAIHVAVVDPGVGSDRRGLLARTDHGTFVGPDNGVLWWALRDLEKGLVCTRALQNPAYRIAPVGVTFDGRDLFVPAAAHLAAGADPATFGPVIDDPMELPWPEPQVQEGRIEGEMLVVDHFGNLITNISLALVSATFADRVFSVLLPRGLRAEMSRSYTEIRGALGAVVNGAGLIEIATQNASAAAVTGCLRGDRIIIELQGIGK